MAIKGGDRQQLNYYFQGAISEENTREGESLGLGQFFSYC